MPPETGDAILSQSECREIFGAVQQAAAALGVSDVEALFGAHCAALTRFANNAIHQNVAEQDRWLSVRVAIDHKTARATTNRFDPDSIREAVVASPRAGPFRGAQSGFAAARRTIR